METFGSCIGSLCCRNVTTVLRCVAIFLLSVKSHTKGGVKGEFFFILGRILKTVPIQERERERERERDARLSAARDRGGFLRRRLFARETIRNRFDPRCIFARPNRIRIFSLLKEKKRSNSLSNRGEKNSIRSKEVILSLRLPTPPTPRQQKRRESERRD